MTLVPPSLIGIAGTSSALANRVSTAPSAAISGQPAANVTLFGPLPASSVASRPSSNSLQGISHFLSLLEKRDRFWGPQIQRLRGKLTDIIREDRESAAVIAYEALKIKQPNAVRLGQLIWAVHKTHTRMKRWPAGVERQGPLAAFYIFRRKDSEARDSLQRQLIQPSTLRIGFHPETGAFSVTDRPFVSKIDPMEMVREDDEAACHLTPALSKGLGRVFSFLYEADLTDARRDYQNLCRRVCLVLRHDPEALGSWLKSFEAERAKGRMDAASWRRYRRGLYAAADFIDGWRGRVAWNGDPIAYFLANGEDLKTLRAFYHRVEKGTVRSIRFDGGKAELESLFPVRRGHLMAPTGYSYGDAAHTTFLPGPSTGWGVRDFGWSELIIADRIQRFFERLEGKLNLTPATIQRVLKIPYYSIRTARTGMTPAYMEDRVLDRLEMTEMEKEKIRHLQTLLALARDRRNEVESGPYREQGRLLWYYRWLHQIHQGTMQELYRRGVAQEGVTEIEFGRARIDDRAKLVTIAETIGVPKIFLDAFVDHLLAGYEAVGRRMGGNSETFETNFPNASWSVPFATLGDEDLEARLSLFRNDGSGESRAELTFRSGLKSSQARALSLQGTLWAAVRERELTEQGLEDEARRLRILRAVREFRRKPVGDRAGFYEAGRLLRFTRLMMTGRAAEDVIRDLGLDIPTPAYTYWEWGFTAMPAEILKSYADLLAAEGVISEGTQGAFLKHVHTVYNR